MSLMEEAEKRRQKLIREEAERIQQQVYGRGNRYDSIGNYNVDRVRVYSGNKIVDGDPTHQLEPVEPECTCSFRCAYTCQCCCHNKKTQRKGNEWL